MMSGDRFDEDDIEAPLSPRPVGKEAEHEESSRNRSSLHAFLWFNFLISPFLIVVVCLTLGGLLALVEGWGFADGFYYVAGTVAGISQSSEVDEEMSLFGEIMEIIISILALTMTGAIVGLAAIMSLSTALPDFLDVKDSLTNASLTLLVFIPAFILFFCAVSGGLLAVSEHWAFRDGFEFLVQTVCGLSSPLTARSPEGDQGKVIALVFAIASLGITSVIVGLVGHMSLCEDTIVAIEDAVERFEARAAGSYSSLAFALFGAAGRRASHPRSLEAEDGGGVAGVGGGGPTIDTSSNHLKGIQGGTASEAYALSSPSRRIKTTAASPMSARDVVRANVQRRKSDDSPAFKLVGRVTTSPLTSPMGSEASSHRGDPAVAPSPRNFSPRKLGSGL